MPRTRQKTSAVKKVRKLISKIKLKPIRVRSLGTVILVIGVILLAIPQIYKSVPVNTGNSPTQPLPVVTSETATGPIQIDGQLLGGQEASQPPMRIVIPRFQIDLPIVEAPVINGAWELSETTASHGIGSANPGQVGNTVIFAHAREGLFLPLREIQIGDSVYVLTKDRWYRYRVSETKLVDPDQIEVISQTDEEKITLFTCSGFLDSKRLIVSAVPARP